MGIHSLSKKIMTPLFLSVVLASSAHSAFDSASNPQGKELHISRVTPAGNDVPPARQIVITFDRPITPLGDMFVDAAKAPVVIAPAPACRWHWVDPRSLACELDAKDTLLPATRYEVTVKNGLKAEDGSTLQQDYRTYFTTERPKVTQYSFTQWLSPSTPVVRLVFNQPVSQPSVAAHVSFSGQVGVKVEPDPYFSEIFYVLPLPSENSALIFPNGTQSLRSDDRVAAMKDESGNRVEARRVWLVSPIYELPADSHVSLLVAPGLRGYAGALLGQKKRTIVEMDTFPEFRFLGVKCRSKSPLITPAIPLQQQSGCDPLSRISLVFSSPVISDEIKKHLKLQPTLAGDRTDYDPWSNVYPSSSLSSPHKRGKNYEVQLPEHLKAFQTYSIDGLANVRDEFGRAPVGVLPMQFKTDHRSQRLRLSHPVAVLEKDAPTAVPLFVTNLTDVEAKYRTLTGQGTGSEQNHKQDITRVWDVSYAVPASIREMLAGQSGVVSGLLFPHPTPPTIDGGRYFNDDEGDADPSKPGGLGEREFFAQVTPFQVHVKLGHYNTLVWVTSLAKGNVISNARIRVYEDSYTALTSAPKALAEGTTDKQGIATLPGRVLFDPENSKRWAYGSFDNQRLMVRVDVGADMALLPLDGNFEIDTYRASRGKFMSSPMKQNGHVNAWGTTAQGVYRLGDTIQYKLYVRNQNNVTLEPVTDRDGYRLEVLDPTGKLIQETTDIALSPFGAYSGEVKVPPNGSVGWYSFRLSRGVDLSKNRYPIPRQSRYYSYQPGVWVPMQVLVADFTPAPFQVQTTVNGEVFEPGDSLEVSTRATLHAGGPYSSAGTRVTARVWPQAIEAKVTDASNFAFDSTPVSGYCDSLRRSPDRQTIYENETQVDERGELRNSFTVPESEIIYGRMELESAVRDERGKYVASRAPAQFRARDRYVGLHSDEWTLEEGKPATIQFLVIDKTGRLAPNVPVSISVHGEVVTAARVKGAGNAYLTSYDRHWEDRGACSGVSSDKPQSCSFTPTAPGLYSIQATIHDTHGKEHQTEVCTWVTGKGRVMWQEPEDMSLSVVPEKESYKVGDKARYLIRNPFPGARALISIERFGVIKSWTQTLKGNTPIIEFPIEADYLPGFYLSVVVTSPRVAPVPGPDTLKQESSLNQDGVDLGRPTYRIGYVRVPVSDPYKTLDITIQSDRPQYKPRENVTLTMRAKSHKPAAKEEPIEFAVAVLDEAVFDLIQDGKNYFDPYEGFYQLDNLDLVNYGILSRLVGLQKFEKKGANAGGDGGAGFDLRSVSKYVAYWNPSVTAGKDGRATLQFQLPDNLTGWRVFAVGVTPSDRLGLGDYKFKSSKLTELRPVMPNQLTEGDQFNSGFSVLNRSAKPRTLTVEITASGAIDGQKKSIQKTLELGPFKRESVWLPLQTKGEGAVVLTAKVSDSLDKDALTHTVPVHKRVSLDVAASYGTTEQATVTESILFPSSMQSGIGSLSVSMSPTVIGNIEGAFAFARDYPYGCWEQKLTRALMAASYLPLRDRLPSSFTWPNAQGLTQGVLDEASSYQAPNGGMAFWVAQDDRVSPYLSAATALGFNELRKAGYRIPEEVDTKLFAYLEKLLREKAASSFYSEGMVSSVRAVALKALAERKKLTMADLNRYRSAAPQMDLFGQAAYLEAALHVKGGDGLAQELAQRILSHSNSSGGKFQFTEVWDDGYSQMLATPLRAQCAILNAFLAYGETPAGAPLVGDIPFKLVRSITQARGNREHWENTQENLYCMNAIAHYSQIYEKESPSMTTHVALNGVAIGESKFTDFRDPPALVTRPNQPADAGQKANLHIERAGAGRLYYATRLTYSPQDQVAAETNAGIEIHREYNVERDGVWHLLSSPMQVKLGEIVRVDLYLSLPAARHFVVVDDPVPGGLEPVNRDLATASTVDADKAEFQAAGGSFYLKYSDWSEYGVSLWSFYHRELKHDSARFYADYLPAGHYHLSYAAQAMAEGHFAASPAKAEEMYDPDVYGKGLPARFVVEHD